MLEFGETAQTLMSARLALQAEAQAYPTGVRIWMGVMATLFFGGIVFTPWRVQARYVVGVMIATFVALVVGKAVWPEIARATIGAIVHLVLWSPLLFVLVWDRVREFRRSVGGSRMFDTIYGVWLYAVIAVLTISLVLDGRDVFKTLVGPGPSHDSRELSNLSSDEYLG